MNTIENTTLQRRAGVRRMKRHALRIDMTPMVDLGFLLVSFFVFTSELSRPVETELYMPKDGKPMPVGRSTTLTVLLAKDNRIFYYEGNWDQLQVHSTNYHIQSGIGAIIRQKQLQLDKHPVNGEGRTGLMLIIKPGREATYKNIIDALDETAINKVNKYVITSCTEEEMAYLLNYR